MCILLLSYRRHTRYRLVLAVNRDESYARPSAHAHFWDESDVLGGRDLAGGGSWLGITRSGRLAALTNVRDGVPPRADAPSRGALVGEYLEGMQDPRAYLALVAEGARRYNGFNLLVGDRRRLYYLHSRAGPPRELGPGLYGLGNQMLDAPQPKLRRGKDALARMLKQRAPDPEALLELLLDKTPSGEAEQAFSSIFVQTPNYGTRASSVLLWDQKGGITFMERTHGSAPATVRYDFDVRAAA